MTLKGISACSSGLVRCLSSKVGAAFCHDVRDCIAMQEMSTGEMVATKDAVKAENLTPTG